MIAYVKGILTDVSKDGVIIDIGNVGINVKLSDGFLSELPGIGSEIKIHTYTYVKEDAFLLYGFATKDELELFRKMITVNGVGPKGALAILSVLSAAELRFAIFAGDAKAISKANGIGAKTAERMILDLRDKISLEDSINALSSEEGVERVKPQTTNREMQDAIEALVALGYGLSEATRAVKQVDSAVHQDADAILKASLKFLI